MPVLDASFIIDLEKERPEAERAVEVLMGLDLRVPSQAAREFLAGAPDPTTELHRMKQVYRLVPDTEDHVLAGARLYREARAKGWTPSWADVAIAAEAVLSAHYVVTANARDFLALGCTVWDYRKSATPPVLP